ncbi:MAG: hypothetical protein IPM29_29620 [Planctomycetes bacterium]|nr:hypothetical protein [Planctomycetota bacterium]
MAREDAVRWAAAAAVLLLPVPAQSVLLVGPGGFPDITAAIAAASPGDVVRVASGRYGPFVCDKAVTIAALPGASVAVAPLPIPTSNFTTWFAVPAGQSARVRDIDFTNPFGAFFVTSTFVSSGTVVFESCDFDGALGLTEVLLVQDASVALRDCSIDAGLTAFPNPAIRAVGAGIVAVDCRFVGSDMTFDGGLHPGDGILASASSLHLVRCRVEGGDANVTCAYPAGDGVRTNRGDLTWIADSVLVAGGGPCTPGGHALHNTGASPVRLARTTLVPSSGAAASIGPTAADALIGLAAATQPLLLGGPWRVDYRTVPHATLFVFASLDLMASPPAVTVETTWLPPPFAWFTTLVAGASGVATLQTTVPNVPALRELGVWLHAVDLASSPWHVAAPIGGLLH